jgi:hypothetical protein
MAPIGPLIIAIGLGISAAVVPALRRSRSRSARALVRDLFGQPTGPNGFRTPSDFRRAALQCAATFLGCIVVAFAVWALADHWLIKTPPNTALSGLGLFFFFAALFAAYLGVGRWRRARRMTRSGIAGTPDASHTTDDDSPGRASPPG